MPLLELNNKGLYCSQADIYIDPNRKVDKAIVTHAHADHARPGMGAYLSCDKNSDVLKFRLGKGIKVQSLKYGEKLNINGVSISLHPSGHIVGSAQVRLEYNGEVWVVTGDYKLEDDGLCESFESVKCNVFVTESTFALPMYQWPEQNKVVDEILKWWDLNSYLNRTSVILTYSLGKAQRLLFHLQDHDKPIFAHKTIVKTNEALFRSYPTLKRIRSLEKVQNKSDLAGALVFLPPGLSDHSVYRKISPYSIAMASGWMAMPGLRRNRNTDRSFTMSDHADWNGLVSAVKRSEAEKVIVMHGYIDPFVEWLNANGKDASGINSLRKGASK
ncbi:MAG: ligase-associated DNA damage response exonuclease [Bacteroidia bacterium]|nr:ligase-associated DNA damage response exonuclease [Bacteroidia bacterium]